MTPLKGGQQFLKEQIHIPVADARRFASTVLQYLDSKMTAAITLAWLQPPPTSARPVISPSDHREEDIMPTQDAPRTTRHRFSISGDVALIHSEQSVHGRRRSGRPRPGQRHHLDRAGITDRLRLLDGERFPASVAAGREARRGCGPYQRGWP